MRILAVRHLRPVRRPAALLLRRSVVILLAGFLSWLPAVGGCGETNTPGSIPAEFQQGEAKFTAKCARCHGERGAGTSQGPPLVHKIYEPGHHPDVAFQVAAANGVRAHHWQFGNMPKIEGVTQADVADIIKYVRWLQRQAGIF